jgi:hypothetical protein
VYKVNYSNYRSLWLIVASRYWNVHNPVASTKMSTLHTLTTILISLCQCQTTNSSSCQHQFACIMFCKKAGCLRTKQTIKEKKYQEGVSYIRGKVTSPRKSGCRQWDGSYSWRWNGCCNWRWVWLHHQVGWVSVQATTNLISTYSKGKGSHLDVVDGSLFRDTRLARC